MPNDKPQVPTCEDVRDALASALRDLLEDIRKHCHHQPAPGYVDHIRAGHDALRLARSK